MSRNHSFVALFAGLSLLLAAMSSCSDGDNYVNALPADAALVASVNLNQLAAKGGVDNNMVQPLADAMKSELRGADALIERIVDNPLESGLDLREKVYFFVSPQASTAGMLARVSDRKKLATLIGVLEEQQLCEKPVESDGCTWTVVGGGMVAYTDAACLVMGNMAKSDPSSLQHRVSKLLRQKDGEGYAAGEDFGRLSGSRCDMAMFVSMDLLPRQYLAPLTMGVSADLDMKDVKSFVSLNFEDGKVVVEGESLTTDKLMNEMMEKQLEASREVEGSYLDMFPANTGLWVTGNVDGGKIYDLLCENPTVRRGFETSMMPVDFELIFNSIKGDMAMAIPDPFFSNRFIAYADVTDSHFLSTFENLKPLLSMTGGAMKLYDCGENEYEFRARDGSMMGLSRGAVSFWFGVKDGRFYVTNDRGLVDMKVTGLTLRGCKWGKQVKGKRFFMAVNIPDLQAEVPSGMGVMLPFLAVSDYITVESSGGKDVRMEWVMKNRSVNALRQIVSQYR